MRGVRASSSSMGLLVSLLMACSSTPSTPDATLRLDGAILDRWPSRPDTAPPDGLRVSDQAVQPDGLSVQCESASRCPSCVAGVVGCAEEGARLRHTCCSVGDSLRRLASGRGSEVVDLETDGDLVILCGGFGADVSRISDPQQPQHLGRASDRCQRIAFGPKLADGSRVFYLTHHGDSWVKTPFLGTYQIGPNGAISEKSVIRDEKTLFEGMAYHQGVLYLAAHQGGLITYQVDQSDGSLTRKGQIEQGVKNAWKVAVGTDVLYVADAGAGLGVYSLVDPFAPRFLRTVRTLGPPRDVVARDGRVYVAMGGAGVDIFDATIAEEPRHLATIGGPGSAQAVAVSAEVIAVASWNHLAVYDPSSFATLGVERTRAAFEQDLGVTVEGRTIFVGEWEGLHMVEYRPGRVGPSIWLDEDILTLDPERPSSAVLVKNRGVMPLKVDAIAVDNDAFSVTKTSLEVAPFSTASFEVRAKSGTVGRTTLRIQSNDADPVRRELAIALQIEDRASRLDVGDKLTDDFGFLDPTGAKQLSNLEGKVIVLAYFALF